MPACTESPYIYTSEMVLISAEILVILLPSHYKTSQVDIYAEKDTRL